MLLVGHNQYCCDGKPYRGPDFHPVTKTSHDGENVSRVAGQLRPRVRQFHIWIREKISEG